jgi:CYTH domain-containing protein
MGKGPFEIERRYLAQAEPGLWSQLGAGLSFRQGYLPSKGPSVRIRTGEPRGPVLTSKSGRGVKRREVECVVSPDVAEALFEAAGKRVVEKVRYGLGPWELDRFTGEFDGLILLEIELDHEDTTVPPPPKGVDVLREVTDDKRFTNGYLASMDKKDRSRFVRKVYCEVGL